MGPATRCPLAQRPPVEEPELLRTQPPQPLHLNGVASEVLRLHAIEPKTYLLKGTLLSNPSVPFEGVTKGDPVLEP